MENVTITYTYEKYVELLSGTLAASDDIYIYNLGQQQNILNI